MAKKYEDVAGRLTQMATARAPGDVPKNGGPPPAAAAKCPAPQVPPEKLPEAPAKRQVPADGPLDVVRVGGRVFNWDGVPVASRHQFGAKLYDTYAVLVTVDLKKFRRELSGGPWVPVPQAEVTKIVYLGAAAQRVPSILRRKGAKR